MKYHYHIYPCIIKRMIKLLNSNCLLYLFCTFFSSTAMSNAGIRIEFENQNARGYTNGGLMSPTRCERPYRGATDCTQRNLWYASTVTFTGDLRNITLTRETSISIQGGPSDGVSGAVNDQDQITFKTPINGYTLIRRDTCQYTASTDSDYDPNNNYTVLHCQNATSYDVPLQPIPGMNITTYGGQFIVNSLDLGNTDIRASINFYFVDPTIETSTVAIYNNYLMNFTAETKEYFSDGLVNIATLSTYTTFNGTVTETADVESMGASFDSQQIVTDKSVNLNNIGSEEFNLADIYFTIDGSSDYETYGPYAYSKRNTQVAVSCDDAAVAIKYEDKCINPRTCKPKIPIGTITAHLSAKKNIDSMCAVVVSIPYE